MRIVNATLLTLAVAALAMPAVASAQLGVEYYSYDSVFDDVVSDSLFVAEGRFGDLGGAATFELDLGQSTAAPAQTAQFDWGNDVSYPFSLSFDPATRLVTFTVDGVTLTYTSDYSVFDAIFIRTRAVPDLSFVGCFYLTVDGIPVPGNAVQTGPNGLGIMQIYGSPLQDGFTLSGTVKMRWNEGFLPANSQLAFQIKVVNMLTVPTESQSWGSVKALFQ